MESLESMASAGEFIHWHWPGNTWMRGAIYNILLSDSEYSDSSDVEGVAPKQKNSNKNTTKMAFILMDLTGL